MISIIICTRNRATHLQKTLESLASVDVPDGQGVEVLIIDNGSTDATPEVAQQVKLPFARKRIIREPKPGLDIARNQALREARGKVLLFADDDVRFPEDWIDGMVAPIIGGDANAVAGGVRIAPNLQRSWMEPWHKSYLAHSDRLRENPLTDMVGANMAFTRDVLEEVPHFDENLDAGALGLSGESHFAERLYRAGFTIAPAFDVEVEHHFDPSRLKRAAWKQAARKLGRSQAYIHYHWRHEQQTFPDGHFGPYLELVSLYARMMLKRLLNVEDVLQEEGMAGWESYYLRQIAYIKQGIKERKQPRLYEKYGLRKKPADN